MKRKKIIISLTVIVPNPSLSFEKENHIILLLYKSVDLHKLSVFVIFQNIFTQTHVFINWSYLTFEIF